MCVPSVCSQELTACFTSPSVADRLPTQCIVSSVQGLTDHPCCAAGSSQNQNHNTEEHLDTKCAVVCVADVMSELNVNCGLFSNLRVT